MVKFPKYFFILAVTLIAFTFLFSTLAAAQDAVKVIFLTGSPKIAKAGSDSFDDCKVGMAVGNGDRAKTGPGDALELAFSADNSKIVRIGENSDVFIRKTQAPYSIELLNGEAMALIRALPSGSTFEVRTPVGLSGARGTGWSSNTDGKKSVFGSHENSIYVKGIDNSGKETGEVMVDSGWKTTVDALGKPGKLEALSQDEIDRWKKWREDLAGRLGRGADLDKMDDMADKSGTVMSNKENVNETRDQARIGEKEKYRPGKYDIR